MSNEILCSSEEILYSSKDGLGSSQAVLGSTKDVLGSSKEVLGASEEVFGPSEEVFGSSKDVSGSSKEIFDSSKDVYGPSGEVSGPSGEVYGSSGERFRSTAGGNGRVREWIMFRRAMPGLPVGQSPTYLAHVQRDVAVGLCPGRRSRHGVLSQPRPGQSPDATQMSRRIAHNTTRGACDRRARHRACILRAGFGGPTCLPAK